MENDKKNLCVKCGAELEEDALFCAECGAPVMKKEELDDVTKPEGIKEKTMTENESKDKASLEADAPESGVPKENAIIEDVPTTETNKEERVAIVPLPLESPAIEESEKANLPTQKPSEVHISSQEPQQAAASVNRQIVQPQPPQFQQPQQQLSQQPVYAASQPQPNITVLPKDQGLAATLGLVFGPAGLLYANIKAGLIMMCIAIPLYFILLLLSGLTLGIGFIFLIFAILVVNTVCAIWGYRAADKFNKELMSGQLPSVTGNGFTMPSMMQNWKNPFQR